MLQEFFTGDGCKELVYIYPICPGSYDGESAHSESMAIGNVEFLVSVNFASSVNGCTVMRVIYRELTVTGQPAAHLGRGKVVNERHDLQLVNFGSCICRIVRPLTLAQVEPTGLKNLTLTLITRVNSIFIPEKTRLTPYASRNALV